MSTPTPVLLSWSSGKDCAMSLMALREDPAWEIAGLITTVNERYGRVAMHGTREELLWRQAAALDLPLRIVYLPDKPSNEEYEARMADAMGKARREGIEHVAFGDLFLEDVRAYRENQLARAGMHGVFPIWRRDTRALSETLLQQGWRIILTCVDAEQLDPVLLGRDYDRTLLAALPESADPCGENGEFHSFVWNGPPFREPLAVMRGDAVVSDGRFHFLDLLPRPA